MSDRQVPDEVRRFVNAAIPSVPFLEALLILKDQPSTAWEPAMLARRLYVSETVADQLLADLQIAGVTAPAPGGRGQCYAATGELAAMLDQVARYYTSHLVEITALIHNKGDRRARQFADAFRWKK
jgi:hypothetical protein